ncbi:hypothetical protein ACW9H6_10060 [Pseudomonas sp. SDO528_S397]|nr:hypothetical protein [Pseudomonas alliivorans]MEE4649307.1 hypothetical protein [Pseudomonas alliivorans]
MSYINLPHDQQRAISAVDTRSLQAALDKCLREEQVAPICELGLRECGDYVASELHAFERAMAAHNKAKAHAKREQTRTDVLRAGNDLVHAVQQMKSRVETEQNDGLLFYIDDQILAPFHFSKRLAVSVRYRWRSSPTAEWADGQTTFTYDYSPVPDYVQLLSKRKPSAAKAASDQQDKLYREWEYLKMQALCSMREFFRNGGDGIDIPKSFVVRQSQHGGGLNNFSCNFWQPA